MIVPVILSGGSGTRLWPVSRRRTPKQLLALTDDRAMLRATAERLEGMDGVDQPVVVCNEQHRFLVTRQLAEAGFSPTLILEPVGRNTAPAVAAAAILAAERDPGAILLVLPADHVIRDEEAFRTAVKAGRALAGDGHLVTFGIVPTRPETGYGYIRAGEPVDEVAYRIERFVEKPDLETARGYVAEGGYFWNSGMFMFTASSYLTELEAHAPAIAAAVRSAVSAGSREHAALELDAGAFAAGPSDSIDFAVMEHTDRGVVIPLDAGWSDVGSWAALWDLSNKDTHGNVILGDVATHQVTGSYLRSEGRLVAVVGIDDVVVVETADAVLVAGRDRAQGVKDVVETLREEERPEPELHLREDRPWGCVEVLTTTSDFQVKQVVVDPGEKLPPTRHHNRAEHWVVVRGTARVTVEGTPRLVPPNETFYFPAGAVHQIENPKEEPLVMVEVQYGSSLGDEDREVLPETGAH